MLWPAGVALLLALLIAPWWALSEALRAQRELKRLRERLDALERAAQRAPEIVQLPAPAPPRPAPPPGPMPIAAPAASAPSAGVAAAPPRAAQAPAASPASARSGFEGSRAEQLVGGIWLQNVGSVLLLLGVFFLILWGYTTGRMGPGALVAAGALLGIALTWRGGIMARGLPAFGHAVMGIGLGTVYLSLYLGHFTLRVLAPGPAFALLALVSIAAVSIGLRFRAQTIAVLGVIGAFIPQLIAVWIPLRGFSLPAAGLLAYLALVDLLVFALAAGAGWVSLDLAALLVTTVTWAATFESHPWGWGVQIGLCALYLMLGLAPLPRLMRARERVRNQQLAVVALAPLLLMTASWSSLSAQPRAAVAILLFTLAALYVAATWWVDLRRPERDLWRPLTGAAALFATGALERAVGGAYTPMAWCTEGALLVWLGLGPGDGWLRLLGYAIEALGALRLIGSFVAGFFASGALPLVSAEAARDLFCIAMMMLIAYLTSRRREALAGDERLVPDGWTLAGNGLLMLWFGRESNHMAQALEGTRGRWNHLSDVGRPTESLRVSALTLAIGASACLIQALVLLRLGLAAARGALLRATGYVIGALAGLVLLLDLVSMGDPWSDPWLPVLHPTGLATLVGIAILLLAAHGAARQRARLMLGERRLPEIATVLAHLVMLAWAARESGHLAHEFAGGSRGGATTLGAVLTSGAWTVQAALLMTLGWASASAFMRWLGLGLFGLTVLKFLLFDLAQVDVFWRFVTAILVGLVLLAVSYFYQRRRRAAGEPSAG